LKENIDFKIIEVYPTQNETRGGCKRIEKSDLGHATIIWRGKRDPKSIKTEKP